MQGAFGAKSAKVLAHLYKDKEALALEHKYLLARDGLAEKQQKKAARGEGAPAPGAAPGQGKQEKKPPEKK